VNLQGVVGDAVTVPLMSVSVKLSGGEQCEQVMEELQLLCAVVDLNSCHDVILPVNVVDELRNIPAVEVVRMPVSVPHDVILQVEAGDADAAVADSTVQSNSGDDVCDADCLGLSDSMCGADKLIAEQHSDASLADCWQQAKANKDDFVISVCCITKIRWRGSRFVNFVYRMVSVCRYYSWHTTPYLVATFGNVKPEGGSDCRFTGL